MKTPHAADDDNQIDQARQVWQPLLERNLSREGVRQIAENFTGFFTILAVWLRVEVPALANDIDRPNASDSEEVRHER